ncbi:MAG: FAD binding domain-containing protein, partial [Chloroflexota bacterium]
MWNRYVNAASTGEVLEILSVNKEKAKIVAGATDLMLEFEKGIRKGIDTVIDISRISGLDNIILDEDNIIHLGPLVTHNQAASTKLLREKGYLLSRASWEVGAPQIRNRGTVAGNIITASPANDTITPLMALNATVTLQSTAGSRKVSLKDFYTGVRKTVMKPDEMLIDIAFPALTSNHKSAFLKVALRRAQAISVVNIAIILFLEGNKINDAVITLGAVAPTIIHAEMAEKYLSGKQLSPEIIEEAAKLTALAAKPIDDLRGTADYRKEMVRVFTKRGLLSILNNEEQSGMPENPITLSVNLPTSSMKSASFKDNSIINTKINGTEYSILDAGNKSLLRLIRENAGLTGTKEGCAEGECGACTIFLDGM